MISQTREALPRQLGKSVGAMNDAERAVRHALGRENTDAAGGAGGGPAVVGDRVFDNQDGEAGGTVEAQLLS